MFNLFMSGFGFVDEFVTPFSSKTEEQRKVAEAANKPEAAAKPEKAGAASKESDRASAVMAIVMLLSFSVASAAAIWAGYNMLRLRSYWLSVAGSFAVMPGACLCCLTGIPIGIWSLTVLLKPEVSSAFR